MSEIWKQMVGKPKFLVSNMGRIMRKDTGHIFPQHVNHNGYSCCSLCDNGKSFAVRCHREVAKAFIPNPDSKEQVNHIDGNKQNNNVSNLEWCNQSENIIHAIKVLGFKPWKNVITKPVICIETKAVYESASEAARQTGLNPRCISKCCNGLLKSYKGKHWRFL